MFANVLKALFGGGRNVVVETAGIFAANKENQAERDQNLSTTAQGQFAKEFMSQNRSNWFDRFIDGVNRIPRPLMALGVLGLFVSAMIAPQWFAERMVGIALVPEPLWWLLGTIVAFYFGGRFQAKQQDFSIARQVEGVKAVVHAQNIIQGDAAPLESADPAEETATDFMAAKEEDDPTSSSVSDNQVIADWMSRSNGGR